MAKSNRLFYLDFVRVISCALILLFHYNMLLIQNFNNNAGTLLNLQLGNINFGGLGVELFFCLSGASLFYSSKINFSYKNYYLKRFVSIYPIFWISYIVITIIDLFGFGINTTYNWRIIYSIFAIDGPLNVWGIQTFYKIGEWFLGAIVIFYIIFPLILKVFQKYPKMTIIISLMLFLLTIILLKDYDYVLVKCIFTSFLPATLFGMLYIRYDLHNKFNFKYIVLLLFAIILVCLLRDQVNIYIQNLIVGISCFCVMSYITKFIKAKRVYSIFKYGSSLTYPIFLVHHWIMYRSIGIIDLSNINKPMSFLVFLIFLLIIIASAFLFKHSIDLSLKGVSFLFAKKTTRKY